MRDVEEAIRYGVDHLSCYSMILDPSSPLAGSIESGKVPPQADEAVDLEMARTASERLGRAGYRHYVSCASCGFDFALPGHECVYEYRHWAAPQIEYVGLGPAAFSYAAGAIYCNDPRPEAYARKVEEGVLPVVSGRRLDRSDEMSRYMVLGVKCLSVGKGPFREIFGVEMEDVFGDQIDSLSGMGLIEHDSTALRLTELGRYYVDNVSEAFYGDRTRGLPQPLEEDIEDIASMAIPPPPTPGGGTGRGCAAAEGRRRAVT